MRMMKLKEEQIMSEQVRYDVAIIGADQQA